MSDEQQLRQLLSDAVSDVEPTDRISRIRASVHPDPTVVPMSHGRSWRYAVAGFAATAAVIGVVAYVSSVAGDDSDVLGPSAQGSGLHHRTRAIATDTALPSPTDGASIDATRMRPVTAYYLGNGPHGTVLYRELRDIPPTLKPLDAAIDGLMTDPVDSDYRTPWRAGWLVSATSASNVIQVEVGDAPGSRPASMSARDASEAVQQVVYTVQAALQSRDPVQFTRHDLPVTSVLGVSTTVPVEQGSATRVLTHISLTDPAEGVHADRGRLVVTGLSGAYDASVVVRLERRGTSYRTKAGTATGAGDLDRLFPWRVVLDTTSLQPGRYVVVAAAGDAKGAGDRDTRTVFLK